MNTSSNPKAIFYENAMVAVCDILGFKAILNSLPLEKIVTADFDYLRKALYSSLHQEKTPKHTPTLEGFQAQNRVGFAWFSDTVLLYSLENNVTGFEVCLGHNMTIALFDFLGAQKTPRFSVSGRP